MTAVWVALEQKQRAKKCIQPSFSRMKWHFVSPWFRALFLALIFLPSGASGWVETAQTSAAETHANRGLQLAQAGNLAAAETELREASKLSPNNEEILASFGTVLAMQKKLEESTRVFKRALQLAPSDLTVRRYLAANLWQLRRFSEARSNLEILLKQKPDDQQSRLLLGMVSENTGNYAMAARMLSSVPALVRLQPESIAALALSYYRLGEKQKARDTLGQLKQHPSGAQAILLGVRIAEQMGDHETAEKLLESIQSQFTDQADFAFKLALIEYHAGRFDASQQTLRQAVDAGHATANVYNLLGWTYYRQHETKEATEALNHAIGLAPGEEVNYLDLADILVASNSLPSALALARQGTTALPNSARLWELRGSIEAKAGQFTDAVSSFNRAIQLDPSRAASVAGLAEAQFSAGMIKPAMVTFDEAMKRFPKSAQVRLSYGAALLKQAESGDSNAQDRAHEMFRSAVVLDPRSPDAHYQLGKLALEEGKIPDAVQDLEKAVNLNPQSSEAHFALSRAYRRVGRTQDAARELELYQKLKSAPEESLSMSNGPAARDSF